MMTHQLSTRRKPEFTGKGSGQSEGAGENQVPQD